MLASTSSSHPSTDFTWEYLPLDFRPLIPLYDPAGFWFVAATTIPAAEIRVRADSSQYVAEPGPVYFPEWPIQFLLADLGSTRVSLKSEGLLEPPTTLDTAVYSVDAPQQWKAQHYSDRHTAMAAMLSEWEKTVVERFSW